MSKQARRFVRTILIGTASLAALIWLAVEQFELSWHEIWELLLVTGFVVLCIIAMAACAALVWVGLRKLFRRGPD